MTVLTNTYLAPGLRFDYPAGWLVTEERAGEDVMLTAFDDGVTQWSITILSGRPAPREVLNEALRAFREEYADVDLSEAASVLSGHEATGIDIDFVYLELPNVASLRAFVTANSIVPGIANCSALGSR